MLESVLQLLETEFRVVAATTDGQRALESAHRLDPDVVVLDIAMPGLNGFQVARELKRTGSRAKIVFLSMYSADDYVSTAITAGADGYVLKTRIQPDLKRALNHVLAGRLFMPTLAALSAAAGSGRGHAVHFYEDDSSFLDEASRFIGTTLERWRARRSGHPGSDSRWHSAAVGGARPGPRGIPRTRLVPSDGFCCGVLAMYT